MKTIFWSLLVVLGLALGLPPNADASLLFNSYEPIGSAGPSTFTVGNEFTVSAQPLTVTKLGVYAGYGVFQDTSVGIWQVADQALVGSTMVLPHTASGVVRIENWYLVDVTPFTLSANTVYRIGTQNMGSDLGWGGTFQVGSGIASVASGSVWGAGWDFMYPSEYYPDDSFLSANAFLTAPVPEPAEWTMLIAGLLVIGFMARRRNNNFA